MEVIGFAYNLKVKITGYADELNLGCGKKQGFRDDFKYVGINTRDDGVVIKWKWGNSWRSRFSRENEELYLSRVKLADYLTFPWRY